MAGGVLAVLAVPVVGIVAAVLKVVLGGSMALIGPSPYRAGHDHPAHLDMRAGLIGLRHVETPDYPELGGHRRTDEFYTENWSVGLDASILTACASDLVWRMVRRAMGVRVGDTAAV